MHRPVPESLPAVLSLSCMYPSTLSGKDFVLVAFVS